MYFWHGEVLLLFFSIFSWQIAISALYTVKQKIASIYCMSVFADSDYPLLSSNFFFNYNVP
jgi:hypothetical protein